MTSISDRDDMMLTAPAQVFLPADRGGRASEVRRFKTKVVIRCDAATLPEIGTGHVRRALVLAKAMIKAGLCRKNELLFATRCEEVFAPGARLVAEAGFRRLDVPDSALEVDGEASTLAICEATHVIFDCLETDPETVDALRRRCMKVVTLDDPGPGGEHADLAINPILHNVSAQSCALVGYSYLIRGSETAPSSVRERASRRIRHFVFASFGGWDERDLAGHLLKSWCAGKLDADLDLAMGEIDAGHYRRLNALAEKASQSTGAQIRVRVQPPTFVQDMASADLAIVAGGLTAFDAAALGTPSIGLPQYRHQLETLCRLEALGTLVVGSDSMQLCELRLARSIKRLLSAPIERRRMSRRGPAVVDGCGTERVIDSLRALFVIK